MDHRLATMVNENLKLLCFGLELSQPNDLMLVRKAIRELQMALVNKKYANK